MIIQAKQAEKSKLIYIKPKEIVGVPVFFIRNKHQHLISGWSLSDLKSRQPIKMEMENIFKMFGEPYEPFELCSPPDFLEIYSMEKNKAIIDNTLPGEPNQSNKIMVAFKDDMCHWVPNSEQIVKIFRCEKLPGKCLYQSNNKTTFMRHVQSCTDNNQFNNQFKIKIIWSTVK